MIIVVLIIFLAISLGILIKIALTPQDDFRVEEDEDD